MESIELPGSYGETSLFLMAVEPYLLHVIWEVDTDTLKGIQDQFGDELNPVKFMLRFYDVTGILFDGGNAQASFDRGIDLSDKKCYVSLRDAGQAYVAEIGYKKRSGHFCSLARSNVTETPRVATAPETERHFIPVVEASEKVDEVIGVPRGPLSQEHAIPEKTPAPATCRTSKCEPEKARPLNRRGVCSLFAVDVLRQGSFANRPGMDAESPFPPRILATQVIQSLYKLEGGIDLTEISEKKFTAGISSKLDNKDRDVKTLNAQSLQTAE